MSRPRPRLLVSALTGLAALGLLATGCNAGTDDELAPAPTRTVTATPSQSLAPAPATVPVGRGAVSPSDVVWAQGSALHVGQRQVDLGPVDVDALVVVPGGVFVLAGGELWFTDLRRLRGTAQTQVTQLRVNPGADRLAVTDTRSGRPLVQGYDTRTGRAIRGAVQTLTPQQLRAGPGTFEVRTSAAGTSVIESATHRRVRVVGLPATFELGGWTSDSAFYGLSGTGTTRAVIACDVVRRRCTRQGAATGSGPVVFGTGL